MYVFHWCHNITIIFWILQFSPISSLDKFDKNFDVTSVFRKTQWPIHTNQAKTLTEKTNPQIFWVAQQTNINASPSAITIWPIPIMGFKLKKFFFNKFFFPFKNFYNNTKKKTFKSNKNNNYINQLLKLPLLKHTHTQHTHTHTHTHTQIITKKRQYQPPSPRNKRPYNTLDGGPNGNNPGIGVVNYCRKDLHTRVCRDPRPTSFLCKCNLTKSYLT